MQITMLLKKARSVLIICHKKPDGDTLGCGFALWNLCKFYGKPADIVCDSPPPAPYAFLPDFPALNRLSADGYDLAFALDCGDAERMGKFRNYAQSVLSVNIDHHKTNNYFCKLNHIVPELSSTCEAVYDLLQAEGVFPNGIDAEILQKIAYYLYIGISTDTGHFTHSNVTAKTLRATAELAETGFDVHGAASDLYRSYSVGRMKLAARAIESLRFFRGNEIGVITLRLKDFAETGCGQADTEGIIDYAVSIGDVKVAVCVTEQEVDRLYRVSMRSKGLDVSKAAAVFGGGGHARASGCNIGGYYEDVIDKIVKALNDLYE